MIQVHRHAESYSFDVKASTIGFRIDRRTSRWQAGYQPRSTKIIQSSIGIRLDNRSRWQEMVSPSIPSQSINARNLRMYYEVNAMSFGTNDPFETISQMGINIPQPRSVQIYLLHHPDLFGLLTYASKISRHDFGAQTQLSLEIYRDIETNDEYLTLYVRQSKYDPEIMKKIKQIRRKYRDLAKGTKGRFLLTTDFRSPG
jgi:hypothetical protein